MIDASEDEVDLRDGLDRFPPQTRTLYTQTFKGRKTHPTVRTRRADAYLAKRLL